MTGKRKQEAHQPEAESPDPVERAGMDSFPASDPPSWVRVHPGRPASPAADDAPDTSGLPTADPRAGKPASKDPADEQSASDDPMGNPLRRGPSS